MIVNELFLKLRMEYGFNLFLPFLFFFGMWFDYVGILEIPIGLDFIPIHNSLFN